MAECDHKRKDGKSAVDKWRHCSKCGAPVEASPMQKPKCLQCYDSGLIKFHTDDGPERYAYRACSACSGETR